MDKVAIKGLSRVEVRDENGDPISVTLEIRTKRIHVLPPIGKQNHNPALKLTVIPATERGAPKGRKPIEWKLMTDLPARTRAGACLITKRLERGRFIWPATMGGRVTISAAQRCYLLEGIDWRRRSGRSVRNVASTAQPPTRDLRARGRRDRDFDVADRVGACVAALSPMVEAIRRHVLAAERVHADDTTVPVPAKAKAKSGRLWVYLRDDRPSGGIVRPHGRFRDRGRRSVAADQPGGDLVRGDGDERRRSDDGRTHGPADSARRRPRRGALAASAAANAPERRAVSRLPSHFAWRRPHLSYMELAVARNREVARH